MGLRTARLFCSFSSADAGAFFLGSDRALSRPFCLYNADKIPQFRRWETVALLARWDGRRRSRANRSLVLSRA